MRSYRGNLALKISEIQPEWKDFNLDEDALRRDAMDALSFGSDKEFATDMGVSVQLVNDWRNGRRTVPVSRAKQIIVLGLLYDHRRDRARKVLMRDVLLMKTPGFLREDF